MTLLVTGAAGFIGYHLSKRLLQQGAEVVGFDNVNPYYDPALKRARIAQLEATADSSGGSFHLIEADSRIGRRLRRRLVNQASEGCELGGPGWGALLDRKPSGLYPGKSCRVRPYFGRVPASWR